MTILEHYLNAVRLHRTRLRIPKPHNQFRPWTPEEYALLGKLPDEEIARKTGRPLGVVSTKRSKLGLRKPNALRKYWTPEQEQLLGTAPDADIALRLDRTISSVKGQRKALKIPAWKPDGLSSPPRTGRGAT